MIFNRLYIARRYLMFWFWCVCFCACVCVCACGSAGLGAQGTGHTTQLHHRAYDTSPSHGG